MPASEAQIKANQANSLKSSGPKSALGRSRSALNSTKHGLAGESPRVEAMRTPEFDDRRAKWAAEQNPVGEAGNWAMDRVVSASFQIERCERTLDEIIEDTRQRAVLAWDEDRALEAATIAARLDKDPVLASRKLQTSLAGVVLLIECWAGLLDALKAEGGWSESDASIALDLLGISPDLRSGPTLIDAPEDNDLAAFRLSLALDEIDRLEVLRDGSMAPLDEMDRRRAMAGNSAMLSKPAKLVLRYEREAWNRYREATREVKTSSATTPATPLPVVDVPPLPLAEPPRLLQPAAIASAPSGDLKPRVSLVDSIPTTPAVLDGGPDWSDEFEGSTQASAPERTQFAGIPTHSFCGSTA